MGSRGCEGTRNQVRNTCIPRLRMTRHMARSLVRSCLENRLNDGSGRNSAF